MKKHLILLLLSITFYTAFSQAGRFISATRQRSSGVSINQGPNYSPLDSYFTYFAAVNPSSVYQDVAMTVRSVDGKITKAISERKANYHALWASTDNRLGYWNTKFGSRYNRDYPIYKFPAGDIPHVTVSNYLDVLLQSDIPDNASPNERHVLVRSRRSVSFEGYSAPNQISLKDFSGSMQIGNDSGSGAFVTVTGSSSLPEDVWTLVSIVDNGASSQLYINGVQSGSNVTVGAGTLSFFGMGTISHIYEHDVAFFAVNTGIGTNMSALASAVNAIVPLNVRVNKPHAYGITAVFDNVDTYSLTSSFHQGSDGLSADTALDEYEWIIINAVQTAPNGGVGLDAIRPVFNYTGATLKRSDFPSYFPAAQMGIVNNISVSGQLKRYNSAGRSWSGIPFRSRYQSDNVAGTPDGTYAPIATAAVINDALKTAVDITYSAALNTGTGLYTDFVVKVDEVAYPATSISFPNSTTVRVNHLGAVTNSSVVRVELRQTATNPLKGTNGKICESHVSGQFYNLSNLVSGPQTVKINLTAFSNTTSSTGWINISDNLNSTGIKSSNMVDTNGTGSGINFDLTDIFDNGSYINSSPPTDSDIPDANITTRCFYEYGDGTQQAIVRLEGFTAGKTVDIKLKFYKDSSFPTGSATGVVTWTDNGGASTTAIPSNLTLATVSKTGLVADSNGYVSFKIKSDTGNFAVGLVAVIFTKYP